MIDKILDEYKKRTEKECYKIEVVEDAIPEVMDDKIGGIPYLPVGEEYPLDANGNPMILLLQVNLENIELENYPRNGILEIFIDKECTWPCDYKVKYFKDIVEYRTDFNEVDAENYVYEKPLKIKLTKDVEHMPLSDYRFYDTMVSVIEDIAGIKLNDFGEISDYFENNGSDLFEDLYDKINIFEGNIGGYADFTQDDPRPIKEAKDKIECLFKIDSNIGHGFMIGDSGIIFGFVSKEDINSQNFESAIVDWDCC